MTSRQMGREMRDNERVLKEGLRKGYGMIVDHLYGELYVLCERLLEEVPRHREFLGFTGNTQTSYACGLYVDGKLRGIVYQKNWTRPPVSRKVKMGRLVWLREPYEGRARSVRGKVQTEDDYGQTTSYKFLQGYKARKDCLQIVMTTGTEYSEYLEGVGHLDVLTGTFEAAKGILAQGFKPMN